MKLIVFISMFSLSTFAGTSYSQTAKINLQVKTATVKSVLKLIERQTDFRFFYNSDLIDLDREVTLSINDKGIDEVMSTLLSDTPVGYRLLDNNFVVLSSSEVLQQMQQMQQLTVTGTVTDMNGEPLPGVNISIKGTAAGVVSNVDGKYSIEIPVRETVLVFSFVGFVSQEIMVGEQTTVNVSLTEDTQIIDEVVIVGYGTQKKVNLTGAISTVNVADIQSIPASNLSNALSGRLAGVTIMQSDGGRPGNASGIRIRANSSWNDNSPLYVIDGVARDKFAFDGLDAADIENLSILKDGASTAIYGSRSANGVVLVTTKKGQIGKPVISYTGTMGVSEITRIPETQNAYQQALFINDGLTTDGKTINDYAFYTPDELEYYKNNHHDWVAEGIEKPVITHHSINVSGGNDRVRYFIGGSYYYETGIFNRVDFDKYTLRGNVEANITRDLTASLDLNMDVRDDMKPYWVNDRGRDNMADYFNMYVLYTPGMRPSYINGLPVGNDMSVNFMQMLNDEYGYHNRKYYNYEANIALRYNVPVVPGLSLKLMYNNYDRHNFTKIFTVPYTRYIFKTTGEHGHILTDEVDRTDVVSTNGNFLSEEYKKTRNYQMNAFINYDRSFGKHDISAVLLFEQAEGNIDQFSASVRNYVTSIVDQLSFGSKDPNDYSITGSGSETARQSYAGRLHYGYADKYLMEVSMRYDGSIVFAKTGRWGFFPSASAAWRISEESFFKNSVPFISNLKLRGSVGSLGNDRDANGDPFYWQWLQLYGYATGAQYGSSAMGILPGVTPNVEITWEKSVTWNGGLDAGFMDNRLTFGLDVFKKHTYDILGSRINTLPSTFGGSMPAENYGVIDSKGYEVEAAYTNRIGKDFIWRVAGNVSYSTNKLIKRDEAENLPAYLSEIGYHTDRSRGYIFTDLIRTQADLDALPEGYTINGATPQLGMMNYKDIRGVTSDEPDGKITSEDQDWIMNHTTPPVSYGFSLGGSWKGWEMNVFFQGVSGHTTAVSYRDQNSRVSKKNLAGWTDHWTPDNTDAVYPRAERPNSASYPVSTFWTRDASFLRLKNLELSYTFQKPVISTLGVSQLRIFLTGSNLFLLEDHVKIYDPETNDTMSYPIMRNYSMGVNLSF